MSTILNELAELLGLTITRRDGSRLGEPADYPAPDVTPGGPDDDGPAGILHEPAPDSTPTDRRDWNPQDLGDDELAHVLSSADLANRAAALGRSAAEGVRSFLVANPLPVRIAEPSSWNLLPVAVPSDASAVPVVGADPGRTGGMIRNTGTTSVFIGPSGASSQGVNSWELEPGDVYLFGHNVGVWASCRGTDSGSLLLSVEREDLAP